MRPSLLELDKKCSEIPKITLPIQSNRLLALRPMPCTETLKTISIKKPPSTLPRKNQRSIQAFIIQLSHQGQPTAQLLVKYTKVMGDSDPFVNTLHDSMTSSIDKKPCQNFIIITPFEIDSDDNVLSFPDSWHAAVLQLYPGHTEITYLKSSIGLSEKIQSKKFQKQKKDSYLNHLRRQGWRGRDIIEIIQRLTLANIFPAQDLRLSDKTTCNGIMTRLCFCREYYLQFGFTREQQLDYEALRTLFYTVPGWIAIHVILIPTTEILNKLLKSKSIPLDDSGKGKFNLPLLKKHTEITNKLQKEGSSIPQEVTLGELLHPLLQAHTPRNTLAYLLYQSLYFNIFTYQDEDSTRETSLSNDDPTVHSTMLEMMSTYIMTHYHTIADQSFKEPHVAMSKPDHLAIIERFFNLLAILYSNCTCRQTFPALQQRFNVTQSHSRAEYLDVVMKSAQSDQADIMSLSAGPG